MLRNTENQSVDFSIYNPEYTINEEVRARILEERRKQEFDALGIDSSMIVFNTPRRGRDGNGVLQDGGHYITIRNKYDYTAPGESDAECDVSALLMYEFNWRDGHHEIGPDGKRGRLWDFRAIVQPYFYKLNGIDVPLPPEVAVNGYQIVARAYHETEIPHIRLDTLCMTSIPMGGHFSSEGHDELGCDCLAQRDMGQACVHKNGGITVLGPLEGRGNGLRGHGTQLMRQSMAVRYNEPLPDTYQAVEEFGFPKDLRPQFYPLETAILMMFGRPQSGKAILHSNNPEKIRALQREGLMLQVVSLHSPDQAGYYQGANFQSKVRAGGHAPYPYSPTWPPSENGDGHTCPPHFST